MRDKIMAMCYDFLIGGAMVCGGSICITAAIVIPFAVFGMLHRAFC